MSYRKPLRFLCLFSLSILLTACSGVKHVDDELVRSARSFDIPSGIARIYVFRDDDVVLNTPITVSVDGSVIGVTSNETFAMASVQPGRHTVAVKAENTDELVVEARGGEPVFVEINVALGVLTNRAHLKRVDSERGRAAVMRLPMVD